MSKKLIIDTWDRVSKMPLLADAISAASMNIDNAHELAQALFHSLSTQGIADAPEGYEAMTASPAFQAMKGAIGDDAANAAIATAIIVAGAKAPDEILNFDPDKVDRAKSTIRDVILATRTIAGAGEMGAICDRTPMEDKVALAQLIQKSRVFLQIMELAGCLQKAMGKGKGNALSLLSEKRDVNMGDDVKRVVPSERALLASPQTNQVFQQKYAERKLVLNQPIAGKKTGPIIVAVDLSNSMHKVDTYMGYFMSRRGVAIAMTLAILFQARKQRRDVDVVWFTSDIMYGDKSGIRVWNFPKGKVSVKDIKEAMVIGVGAGGTQYYGWMNYTLERLKTLKGADVILISDGEPLDMQNRSEKIIKQLLKTDVKNVRFGWHGNHQDVVPEIWNEQKRVMGFRCYGIMIGTVTRHMKAISDKYIGVDAFSKKDVINDIANIIDYV